MSKELEAFMGYCPTIPNENDFLYWSDYKIALNKYEKELQTFKETYELLKQALMPPTAEEVCKALNEYFGFGFYYQDNFFYRSDGIKYIYPLKVSGFTEIQLYDGHLPPHLITLIGRFYEGEIK